MVRVLRILALLAAGGTVVLAVVLGDRFGADPSQVDSPLIGRPVPPVSLERLDGSGPLDLSSLRGEIVVVNFFASWCVPCRYEHDDLVEAQVRYGPAGMRVVGVVYQDSPENIEAMLAELGQGYEVVVDPGSRAAIEFGVFGIPETFFVDREGVVSAKVFGESNIDVLASILEDMIAGRKPESRTTGTVQPGPGQ